ncbi:hypothetical protein [Aquimarina spongiae]|uniref:Uncharacterized protein n=1 Tax=Aquimarina spongiae TaxID=570521 RepID=A0A1M6CEM4_9FLAO|nr:hypothetical protein [Aquimarina spongiae]SHI59479.1 hypothetical protein SAMN04488508_10281 [Aquimarina spongiae]
MDTNIDFKKIWNTQEVQKLEIADLYKKADRLKRYKRYQLMGANAILLITSCIIGGIWYRYQPEYVTTKIGLVLAILAMIIFLIPYNRWISLLKTNEGDNNKTYLRQLMQLKQKQIFQQKWMLSIYFVMLSLGIALYLFEYVSKMTGFWGIVVYTATLLWIGINWWYLRPRVIKKQNAKLDELLQKFEELNNQIQE